MRCVAAPCVDVTLMVAELLDESVSVLLPEIRYGFAESNCSVPTVAGTSSVTVAGADRFVVNRATSSLPGSPGKPIPGAWPPDQFSCALQVPEPSSVQVVVTGAAMAQP